MHRRSDAYDEPHRGLQLSCALMALLAVSDVASAIHEIGPAREALAKSLSDAAFPITVIVADAVCVTLEAVCIARAVRVVDLDDDDTHDYVANCQLCAIALTGLTVLEWFVALITTGGLGAASIPWLVLSLIPSLYYYHVIGRESHSVFWEGVRRADLGATPVDASALPRDLVLDKATGMLVAAGDADGGAAGHVHVRSLRDFARTHADSNLGPRAERLLANATRTTVYPLDESVLGMLYLPEEKVAMTGPALEGAVHLGFYLTRAELVFVVDDEPTRRLLAWYLDEQYLRKSLPSEVLLELSELVISDDAANLADLDDRIDLLDDNLSESVTEVPRDFSDYVNDTRHDLGVIGKFYQELADAADDALADGILSSKRERHLLVGLERRATSLASDAAGLRDYLSQVREGYQERINVRQNSVMSILTIVTTISTPIAIITGWYGMNFDGMDELHYANGYDVVTIVVVALVTLEILHFKRRRWF